MFTKKTFAFLEQLSQNNNRDWFAQHKNEYEKHVRKLAFDFIESMQEPLAQISPLFVAEPKKVCGSLMRVHRDVRFSRNKLPYKTNIGIQFRHELGRDVHAPGFYVHIDPNDCFVGVGCWHPAPDALFKIRTAISENPKQWIAARDAKLFQKHFNLVGDSLIRIPRGFSAEHQCADDLRRKDFIAITKTSRKDVLKDDFTKIVADYFTQALPLQNFLCRALSIKF